VFVVIGYFLLWSWLNSLAGRELRNTDVSKKIVTGATPDPASVCPINA
jgi:hypothetical protein